MEAEREQEIIAAQAPLEAIKKKRKEATKVSISFRYNSMKLYMCVCVYVCMYVCMCVCMCICVFAVCEYT